MKIQQHPRMRTIAIGDEVFSYLHQLFARVEEVFPSAVCVKVGRLSLNDNLDLAVDPQLWRADDIENLSICRYCGSREGLRIEHGTGIPFRVCTSCAIVPPQRRKTLFVWW